MAQEIQGRISRIRNIDSAHTLLKLAVDDGRSYSILRNIREEEIFGGTGYNIFNVAPRDTRIPLLRISIKDERRRGVCIKQAASAALVRALLSTDSPAPHPSDRSATNVATKSYSPTSLAGP